MPAAARLTSSRPSFARVGRLRRAGGERLSPRPWRRSRLRQDARLGNDFVVLDGRRKPVAVERRADPAHRRPASRGRLRPARRARRPSERRRQHARSSMPTAARPAPAATPPAASRGCCSRRVRRASSRLRSATAPAVADALPDGQGCGVAWATPRFGLAGYPAGRPCDTLAVPMDVPDAAATGRRSAWATRTRCSSSTMPERRSTSPQLGRAARAASTVPRARQYRVRADGRRGARCGCGCSSAAPA